MKPALIRTVKIEKRISFDDEEYSFFYNPWHYHPELELTLIIESHGQRLVGDKIENFREGDLVLVGSNLPHVWKNDKIYYEKESQRKAKAIVVKFTPDFLGDYFLDINEMKLIKQLIYEKAVYGIKPRTILKKYITKEMIALSEMNDTEKIIQLLKILHHISISNKYDFLSSLAYRKNFNHTNEKDNLRINTVLDYLIKNYQNEITLDQIASLIHINKNSFCRFLKQKTGKGLIQLLSEIRVGKACQKLQESEESVARISNLVGFNNISNFNRTFKLINGISPRDYRKQKQKQFN